MKEAPARQRRTPFWCQKNTAIFMLSVRNNVTHETKYLILTVHTNIPIKCGHYKACKYNIIRGLKYIINHTYLEPEKLYQHRYFALKLSLRGKVDASLFTYAPVHLVLGRFANESIRPLVPRTSMTSTSEAEGRGFDPGPRHQRR